MVSQKMSILNINPDIENVKAKSKIPTMHYIRLAFKHAIYVVVVINLSIFGVVIGWYLVGKLLKILP